MDSAKTVDLYHAMQCKLQACMSRKTWGFFGRLAAKPAQRAPSADLGSSSN